MRSFQYTKKAGKAKISIRETDQKAQRFLWRFNQNNPVEMAAMIFCANCSPCRAIRKKLKHSSKCQ